MIKKILSCKVTTVIVCCICIAALTAGIVLPLTVKGSGMAYDTNANAIGESEINWNEGGTFGNALDNDSVMVGEYETEEDAVTCTSFGTPGTFNQIFYNKPGQLENYSFRTVLKLDRVNESVSTTGYKMGFYPAYYNAANRVEMFFIKEQDGSTLLSISICVENVWLKTWEIIALPQSADFYESNAVEVIKIGSRFRVYYNNVKLYEFTAEIARAQVGFVSENVTYTASGIAVTETDAFLPEELCKPNAQIQGNTLVWQEIEHAEKYEIKIGEGTPIKAVSPFSIRSYLLKHGFSDGEYKIAVRAVGNESNYFTSPWSDAQIYAFSSKTQELSAPVITLSGTILSFNADSNAASYRLDIAVNTGGDSLDVSSVPNIASGYDIASFAARYLATGRDYILTVTALGDGSSYSDSPRSNEVVYRDRGAWLGTKGVWMGGKSELQLFRQETFDGDNYAAGYDLIYAPQSYANFTVSADVVLGEQATLNTFSKAGIKLAVSETCYFTCFILPGSNTVTLLCTKDGGAGWVQIWGGNYPIPGADFRSGVNLKLERREGIIAVYVNGALLHTESGFTVGASEKLKIGCTAEAVSNVRYRNIRLTKIDGAVS